MDPSERDVIKRALDVYVLRISALLEDPALAGVFDALSTERGRAYVARANIRDAERAENIKEQLREKDRERKARDRANIARLTK